MRSCIPTLLPARRADLLWQDVRQQPLLLLLEHLHGALCFHGLRHVCLWGTRVTGACSRKRCARECRHSKHLDNQKHLVHGDAIPAGGEPVTSREPKRPGLY